VYLPFEFLLIQVAPEIKTGSGSSKEIYGKYRIFKRKYVKPQGLMNTVEAEVRCPFCGEQFTIIVDTSQDEQTYIEDCFVCCRPIQFTIRCEDGELVSVDEGRT
jgi:hypothetical protein